MKLNKFFIFVFCFILLLFSYFAKGYCEENQISAKLEQIVDIMSAPGGNRDFDDFYKQLDESEKSELYKYVKENPEKIIPLYYLILSNDIFKTNKNEAMLFYIMGIMRSKLDVFMCEDETSYQQIVFYPSFAPDVADYYQTLDDIEIAKIYRKFLRWDSKHPQHLRSVWACFHGLRAFDEYPTIKSDKEYLKLKKDMRNSLKKFISESVNSQK